jgi:hypothetical protein
MKPLNEYPFTEKQLHAIKENFTENDFPNCCKDPELTREGTGANEGESWGCFKCKCGKAWYIYHNSEEGYTDREPIL